MALGHVTTIRIVNDLIRIHRLRIDYYGEMIYNCVNQAPELKVLFEEIARQSIQFEKELKNSIASFDGQAHLFQPRRTGTIFLTWARAASPLVAEDPNKLLRSCQTELKALHAAYNEALHISLSMDPQVKDLIETEHYGISGMIDSVEEYADGFPMA